LFAASLLVVVVVVVVTVATALGLCPNVRLALPLCCLGDWGVPGAAFCSLGALVRQAGERKNILDVMGDELLQHLLIPYSLVKCNHHRSIRDMRNGIVNLREPLDEGAQGFPRALLDGMKVGLIAQPTISALKVGHELMAQPRVEGPLREIHELRMGHPSQGYREAVGHDDLISACNEDGGGVDLLELIGLDRPIVLLW
jgi:hypothetical protein